MVDIICTEEQVQEILSWLTTKDTVMFGDVTREDFEAKDGHAGIFEIEKTERGLCADCDGYLFSRGHFLDREIMEYFAALKEAFPSIGLQGSFYIGLSDDAWVGFNVDAGPNTDTLCFEQLDEEFDEEYFEDEFEENED